MANKTWRPVGVPGPRTNELESVYDRVGGAPRPGAVAISPTGADTILVRLTGVVGARHTEQLRSALVTAVLRSSARRLVLDLRELLDVDSLGLGTLAAGCQVAADCGVDVVVETSAEDVTRKLRHAGVPPAMLTRV